MRGFNVHIGTWRKYLLLGLLVVGMSVALAACGVEVPTNPPAPTATAAPVAPTATAAPAAPTTATGGGTSTGAAIEVTLNEWSIEPKTIDVTAGKVTFKVTNKGKFPHNFAVVSNGTEVMKTKNIAGGGTETLEMDLTAGSFQTICDIPGHKDQGMVGTLTTK
jgi:uncharacterized cupredoxin-like copper-binding protein